MSSRRSSIAIAVTWMSASLGCNAISGIGDYAVCETCSDGAIDSTTLDVATDSEIGADLGADSGADAIDGDDVAIDATDTSIADSADGTADTTATTDTGACSTCTVPVGLSGTGCTFAEAPANHATCASAAHTYCTKVVGCYVLGVGPVTASGAAGEYLCFRGPNDTRTITFADLAAFGSCSVGTVGSRDCMAAVHLYAVGKGYGSGVMVASSSGAGTATIVLVGGTTTGEGAFTWTSLGALEPDCTFANRDHWSCDFAAHKACLGKGHKGGYGPVEWATPVTTASSVTVLCID